MRSPIIAEQLATSHLQNIVNVKFGETVLWFNRAHEPKIWFTLRETGEILYFGEESSYPIGTITLTDSEKELLRDAFIYKTGDTEHLGEHYFALDWSNRSEQHVQFDLIEEIERELAEIQEENDKKSFKQVVKNE